MITLLAPGFKNQPVTQDDMNIASLAWGFTLGFGFLTTWTAIKQTRHVSKRHGTSRLNSPYIWMIWLEISVCLSFSIICWLHLKGFIAPSFAFYFCIRMFSRCFFVFGPADNPCSHHLGPSGPVSSADYH